MKRILLPLLMLATMATAQTPEVRMRSLVMEGQRHYERSYRRGMRQCADTLELLLSRHAHEMEPATRYELQADLARLQGNWHYENGNYDSASFPLAEQLYLQALAIYNQHPYLKGHHATDILVHQELAQLYYRTRDYSSALREVEKVLEEAELHLGILAEDEEIDMLTQRAMCLARLDRREALEAIDQAISRYPKNSIGYAEAQRKKGKILMLMGQASDRQQALALYKQYFNHKRDQSLASLSTMRADQRQDYWMRMRPFMTDCYQLEDADPAFLYNVALFSKGLLLQLNRISGEGASSQKALATLRYEWPQIQRRLPKGGCAVEFVQYELRGEQRMGALVLRKTGKPRWVSMPSPDSLYNLQIGKWSLRQRLHSTSGQMKNQLYADTTLARMIWHRELTDAIGPCQKLYFAPDGYLHQLAIEYLPAESLDSTRIYRLTSTRRLMEQAAVRTDRALIIGGVDYNDAQPGGAASSSNDSNAYHHLRNNGAYFSWLPGSLAEADSIYRMRHNSHDTLLTSSDASEESFRMLASNYTILNISTHGCFLGGDCDDGSTDLKPALGDEIMEQSVIVLAGANSSLSAQDFASDQYDGILSAREISGMELEETDLVVLSACQTGMGEVTADGVYGMQRGFKNAGVGVLAVSLWSVDDRATSLLITRFQQLLAEGVPAGDAFAQAREELASTEIPVPRRPLRGVRRNNAASATFARPQYTNAFILIDAIE